MGLEGRMLNDDMVLFGEPVSEKALEALKRKSPTADSIIKSLPPSAFIPINDLNIVSEEDTKAKEDKPQGLSRKEKKKARLAEKSRLSKLIKEKETKEKAKMDLEKELEQLEKEVTEKQEAAFIEEAPQMQEAPQMKDQILELLAGDEEAPSEETISAWKDKYGKNGIHVMAFGEGDVYIYHHLTRGEWKKIKDLMNRLKQSSEADEVEEKLKEKVVLYCTLYPSVDEQWLEYCKAGVLDSLYQMILLNSGFLTPQQAMLLTTQL